LRVEFTASGLTSFAGLELLIRYLRGMRLNTLVRQHFVGLRARGDFGMVAMLRLVLGLVIVGGRRLRHVGYLAGDPLVHRLCGLRHLPTARTLSRWLKGFTEASIERLRRLNAEVVARVVRQLPLRTLTIDVDGTVISTGLTVERAFRGYNPHHRKVPSYYPITAYLAESGHVLRVKNRSGNVADGKAVPFLRELFAQITRTLGRGYHLQFRMDGAFFRQDVIHVLAAHGAGFALQVPFYAWLDLQNRIRARQRWHRITRGVDGFELTLALTPWNLSQRVVMYRKKVHHPAPKNYQLDLFDPTDGHWEYSAVATNLSLTPQRLWHFMCGRGMHEKALGELRGHLAFGTVPTLHYGANSAWQQIVVLAHNLLASFQIETGTPRRARSRKYTALHPLQSARTLRFELFHRAGEIVHPNGVTILRLSDNRHIRRRFETIAARLVRAA
jgi:DDE family transposase